MLTSCNLNKILSNLKKETLLKEFVNLTFNYNLGKSDEVEIFVQNIDDDIILSIYQIGDINKIEFYHLLLKDRDFYKKIRINNSVIKLNYILVKKCLLSYKNKKDCNNFEKFIISFYMDNKKEILLEYLPTYIVNVIVNF